MKKILIYGHGGSYNHGAEAIVKCTIDFFREQFPDSEFLLSSHFKNQDIEFEVAADLILARNEHFVFLDKKSNLPGYYNNDIYADTLNSIEENMICLSSGGDNYCYNNWHRWETIHKTALKKKAISILWSCSIDSHLITKEMIEVLKEHHLITARESITYNALKSLGLNNVVQCSDIAFNLKPSKVSIPEGFLIDQTFAINISPLLVRRELIQGCVLKEIDKVIDWLLNNTKFSIALIPHVVMPMDNDYSVLEKIKHKYKDKRVCLISDKYSASEYKYLISKCKAGIFARTHAAIAAYSSGVPALALGYSAKAKGIARDLLTEKYVMPVEKIQNNGGMLEFTKMLLENNDKIRDNLANMLPEYIAKSRINIFDYISI